MDPLSISQSFSSSLLPSTRKTSDADLYLTAQVERREAFGHILSRSDSKGSLDVGTEKQTYIERIKPGIFCSQLLAAISTLQRSLA